MLRAARSVPPLLRRQRWRLSASAVVRLLSSSTSCSLLMPQAALTAEEIAKKEAEIYQRFRIPPVRTSLLKRCCLFCLTLKGREDFTTQHWEMQEDELCKCNACAAGKDTVPEFGGLTIDPVCLNQGDYVQAVFDDESMENPTESAQRWAARGHYLEADGVTKAGECLLKWNKKGFQYDPEFYDQEIFRGLKALEIINDWNSQEFVEELIMLNFPDVWEFPEDVNDPCHKQYQDTVVLQEPYFEKFQKFNSNTGWNDGGESYWSKIMQALSHYSYFCTGGEYLLCNLKGGTNEYGFVLCDPAVNSYKGRRIFGTTDLGPKAVRSFFTQHRCNELCRVSDWGVAPEPFRNDKMKKRIVKETVHIDKTGPYSPFTLK